MNFKVSPFTEAVFSVVVVGDGMQPTICDGDVVYLREGGSVAEGEIAAFLLADGDLVIRRLYDQDGVACLVADNRAVPPIYAEPHKLHVLGIPVGLCRAM